MNVVEAVREAWVREAEAAIPDPPYREFVDYESWSRAFHLREALISRLLAEHLREPSTAVNVPPIPAMPDAMASNSSIQEAWARFHAPENIRARTGVHRESNPAPVRRRPRVRELCTLVADPDLRHLLP